MKKMLKLLGTVAALAMVLGFGLVGCNNDSSDDDEFPSKTETMKFEEFDIPDEAIELLTNDTVRVKDTSIATLTIDKTKKEFVLKSLKAGETVIQVKMGDAPDWEDVCKVKVGKDGKIELTIIDEGKGPEGEGEGTGGELVVYAEWVFSGKTKVAEIASGLTHGSKLSDDVSIPATTGSGADLTALKNSVVKNDDPGRGLKADACKAYSALDAVKYDNAAVGSGEKDGRTKASLKLVLSEESTVTIEGAITGPTDTRYFLIAKDDNTIVAIKGSPEEAAQTITESLAAGTYYIGIDGAYISKISCSKMSAGGSGTTPADPSTPGTDPSTPGTDPSTPGTDPSTPGTDPSTPGTDPSTPGTDPSTPGTDPSTPGTDPSDPGTDPNTPGTDPSDPGTDPSDPGTDPSDPGTDPSTPTEEIVVTYYAIPEGASTSTTLVDTADPVSSDLATHGAVTFDFVKSGWTKDKLQYNSSKINGSDNTKGVMLSSTKVSGTDTGETTSDSTPKKIFKFADKDDVIAELKFTITATTKIKLNTISAVCGTGDTSSFSVRFKGSEEALGSGKDCSFSDKSINKTIEAGESETITLEVYVGGENGLTSNSSDATLEKAYKFLFKDIVVSYSAAD